MPVRSWALFKAKDLMRTEIKASELGVVELAGRYNVSRATVAK